MGGCGLRGRFGRRSWSCESLSSPLHRRPADSTVVSGGSLGIFDRRWLGEDFVGGLGQVNGWQRSQMAQDFEWLAGPQTTPSRRHPQEGDW